METPLEKLKRLTAWEAEPVLTEDDLDEILASAALEDKAGHNPLHPEWIPTYDINAAAAAGWLTKAGRASSTTETEPESLNVSSKVFDNCCRMAEIYRAKAKTTISFAAV
ncbi:MAG TPA: hypothetical protein PKD26_15420 [Pyrinomonadaceae bacterium]|nr:hypothetical protein [Pyrinomonadaceae bacterium]